MGPVAKLDQVPHLHGDIHRLVDPLRRRDLCFRMTLLFLRGWDGFDMTIRQRSWTVVVLRCETDLEPGSR